MSNEINFINIAAELRQLGFDAEVIKYDLKQRTDNNLEIGSMLSKGQVSPQAHSSASQNMGLSETVQDNTVQYENPASPQDITYDGDTQTKKKRITYTQTNDYVIDGKIDSFTQGSQMGDCYLLADIHGLRQTPEGQQMLSNLIKIDTDRKGHKIYTVTLPGAIKAAEGLRTDTRINPETVAITGTYTFTEEEMKNILKQSGIQYSRGDGDVVLLEAAYEKYRDEVRQTLNANHIDYSKPSVDAGLYGGEMADNSLAGGHVYEAMFILTGIQSDIYFNNNTNFGVDVNELANKNQIKIVSKNSRGVSLAVPTIRNKTRDIKNVDAMLDTLMNDTKDGHIDYVGTVGLATVQNVGGKRTISGHAFTIKSVTSDKVILINPWNPSKEVEISRADFKAVCSSFAISSINPSADQISFSTTTPKSKEVKRNSNYPNHDDE